MILVLVLILILVRVVVVVVVTTVAGAASARGGATKGGSPPPRPTSGAPRPTRSGGHGRAAGREHACGPRPGPAAARAGSAPWRGRRRTTPWQTGMGRSGRRTRRRRPVTGSARRKSAGPGRYPWNAAESVRGSCDRVLTALNARHR